MSNQSSNHPAIQSFNRSAVMLTPQPQNIMETTTIFQLSDQKFEHMMIIDDKTSMMMLMWMMMKMKKKLHTR